MMNNFEKSNKSGKFNISSCNEIYGEITYAGPNTCLYLRDNQMFDTPLMSGHCVKGTLHDLTKVTLLDCVKTSGPCSGSRGTERYYYNTIFPHFVLHGDHHLDPNDNTITKVNFIIDDASVLFNDFDAFGTLIDANPYIEQIVKDNAKRYDREIPIGPNPEILYFTGKHEIFTSDTLLGKISASHGPTLNIGGPKGVYLHNKIITSIEFHEICTFDKAIDHVITLLHFLGALTGRPQNLLSLSVFINSEDDRPAGLDVYWSMPPKRDSCDERQPHPAEVLLDAVRQPDEFLNVLCNWLERNQSWRDARLRFSESFRQPKYSIDRLVGAANMFDILPDSAVPVDVTPTDELLSAKEQCKEIFKRLPKSPERDSILSALGRIGKSNLKNKIRHRGKLLLDAAESQFPDLFTVIDEAVNCRNHYVHGSDTKIDYSNRPDTRIFLTDTLEFVFFASDLLESGWDLKAWTSKGTRMAHPFAIYFRNYKENLHILKSLTA